MNSYFVTHLRRRAPPVIMIVFLVIPIDLRADGMYPCGMHRMKPQLLRVVQESLRKQGFDPGQVNGAYSEKTLRSLVAYERARDRPIRRDEVMVTELLNETLGSETATKLLPKPPTDLTRKHNGLECTW